MLRTITAVGFALWVAAARAEGGTVAAVLDIQGAIGPATSGYFEKALAQAEAAGAQVVILRLDTPGGLDGPMRDIVKAILAAPVPVVGYVAPDGARAASAGTYILYACHLAAMAPATNLGAATPIPVGGSWPLSGKPEAGEKKTATPEDAEASKAINDAVAYIRGLAEKRGRNADWAESAVRAAASLSAEEALRLKVVDLLASDVPDLLARIDGRSVVTAAGRVTLHTADARIVRIAPDWRMRALAVLTNPTIAYALLLIGIYGLLLEGYHPGAVLPGVTGGIALLLALYAFQILPVNYAGLALIALGVALLIAEMSAPSFGVLGFGGIVAFVLGSLLLLDTGVPGFGINLGVIAGIALSAALVLLLTLYLIYRARRAPVVTGGSAMIGETAVVLEALTGEGWARVRGERWRVRCARPLPAGAKARVVGVQGLTLTIEPIEDR
ncbi:MAG TPA: nodulation protein NfeD [Dehalococcoidia bacterium]|nr:nodulation protein NfeD [Dehalococcoidia bacterium]